mgnify:CR=1 FL=1|jgi:hypothetical protein
MRLPGLATARAYLRHAVRRRGRYVARCTTAGPGDPEPEGEAPDPAVPHCRPAGLRQRLVQSPRKDPMRRAQHPVPRLMHRPAIRLAANHRPSGRVRLGRACCRLPPDKRRHPATAPHAGPTVRPHRIRSDPGARSAPERSFRLRPPTVSRAGHGALGPGPSGGAAEPCMPFRAFACRGNARRNFFADKQ